MTIRILPPQLANQIAAGEVVDRPASVIKELVENSIDAGASRIDIDIEQGGCKLIRIRDNGCGITKEDLSLALARHATSKIYSLDDLESIMSLGFRGEALASISSVSRLTLTSKTQEQSEAWLVYAEGRDMSPVIKPAAHPVGTTVEVLDIFYNTPARRRFLKTEKTEFAHIDEVVRRLALAYPAVSFNLQHNGKLIKQYRAVQSENQIDKRVVTICGTAFMQKAIKLSWQHDDLSIHGWIAPNIGQNVQYFYVNGRVVKDRLLTHALKQAFLESNKSTVYSTDEILSYVIYLELEPSQVDVNVHPAKHEVRFHEARLVHDFVYQAMVMALGAYKNPILTSSDEETIPDDIQNPLNHNLNINRAAAGQSIFNTSIPADISVAVSDKKKDPAPNVPIKKANHINENKWYGRLVDAPIKSTSVKEDYISPEQQAVIESLFPKRSEPLAPDSEVKLSSAVKLGRVLAIIQNEYVLLEKQDNQQQKINLLSLKKAQLALFTAKLHSDDEQLSIERLLIPLSILLDKNEQQVVMQSLAILNKFNFECHIDKSKLQLNAVPKLLRNANWQQLLPGLIKFLAANCLLSTFNQNIINWLAEQYMELNCGENNIWNIPKVIQFLTRLEQVNEQYLDIPDMIKSVDLSSVIAQFK